MAASTSSSQPVTALIRVTGPKNLLPRGALERKECNMNWTWLEFLTEGCNLQIEPNTPIFIRTVTTSAATRSRWEANLGDTVNDFLSKYKRPRSSYNVRLVNQTKPRIVKRTSRKPKCVRPRTPRRLGIVPIPSGSKRLLPTKSPLKLTTGTRQPQSSLIMPLLLSGSVMLPQPTYNQIASAPPPPPNPVRRRNIRKFDPQPDPEQQPQVDPVEVDSDSDIPMNLVKDDVGKENGNPIPPVDRLASTPIEWPPKRISFSIDEDSQGSLGPLRTFREDAMSQCTSASLKVQELQRDGIQFQEIKARVITKFAENFDNIVMLRIQHELKQLVQNGNWHKLTGRVPRTGHLLQEIFDIYSTC